MIFFWLYRFHTTQQSYSIFKMSASTPNIQASILESIDAALTALTQAPKKPSLNTRAIGSFMKIDLQDECDMLRGQTRPCQENQDLEDTQDAFRQAKEGIQAKSFPRNCCSKAHCSSCFRKEVERNESNL